jgi:PAS domain S-box-containing protein
LHDKYLLFKLVPFVDRGQKFIILLFQDITKRKQAELKLVEHKERLEDLVAQRTVEYEEANEQLQEEIIERSKVQEELEYSIKHWRETFDVMSDFVSVQDNDLRFVKVNKSLADLFGKKPKELIGKHCYEIMHNMHKPWSTCPHLKAIEKQEIVTEEVEDPHLGKTLLITCSPIFDTKGRVTGTVHVARDITSQKLAQAEREALIKKLQETLNEVKTLRGILPLCSYCKKIRDDEGYWEQVEVYIHKNYDTDISHGICPDCLKEHYPKEYETMSKKYDYLSP